MKRTRQVQAFRAFCAEEVPFIWTTKEGIITSVSAAWCHVTGFAEESCIGNNASMFQCDMTTVNCKEAMARAMASNEEFVGTVVNKRHDGTRYTATLAFKPVTNGFVGRITNIVSFQ
tara:strand:- start:130 stop:480 length:351 start_codon:yes stop_codon:yes gene_type:complete